MYTKRGVMPRKSPAIQAQEVREPAVVDPRAYDRLSEQLRIISDGLLQTRAEVEDNKRQTAEAKAANASLKAQLEAQKSTKAGTQIMSSRGNQAQYDANVSVINDLARSLTAYEEGRQADIETCIRSGLVALNGRNKLIKLADQSAVGWAFVDEYLKCDAASDEEDDRRIRRAESAAVEKRRLKQEANSRGRGGKHNRGRGQHLDANGVPRRQENFAYGYGHNGQQDRYAEQRDYYGHGNGYRHGEYASNAPDPYRQQAHRYADAPSARAGYPYQRQPGPCFKCGGPHLVRYCPRNEQETEEVQCQIEEEYFR
jgi:hypothetical protein